MRISLLFLILATVVVTFNCSDSPTDSAGPISLEIESITALLSENEMVGLQVKGVGFTDDMEAFLADDTLEVDVYNDTLVDLFWHFALTQGQHMLRLRNESDSAVSLVFLLQGDDGKSIVWKGSLHEAPDDPEENWAYHDIGANAAYIFDGIEWSLLVVGPDATASKAHSIIWKGAFFYPPADADTNWAYYNSIENVSYIYNGQNWDTLAAGLAGPQGAPGIDGIDGKDGKDGVDGIDGTDGLDGISIVWKGQLYYAPWAPQTNWAYYNITHRTSYIYNGYEWDTLAVSGTNGVDGKDGSGIIWKGSSITAPLNPQPNWAYYNPVENTTYIWNGAAWDVMVTMETVSFTDSLRVFYERFTADRTPTIRWSYFHNATGYRFRMDNQSSWTAVGPRVLQYTPDTDLSEGAHVFAIQAILGVQTYTKAALCTIQVHVTPPVAPTVSSPAVSESPRPTWTWEVPDGADAIRYQLDSQHTDSWIDAPITKTSFTPTYNLTPISHILFVQARFGEGNWSLSGWSHTRVDYSNANTGIPQVSVLSLSEGIPTWKWTRPAGTVGFRYQVDGELEGQWTEVGAAVKTFSPQGLTTGIHTLYVQALNSNGNYSKSGSKTLTITASPAPVVRGVSTTTSRTPTWSWSVPSTAMLVRFRLNGDVYNSWTVYPAGTTSFTPSTDLAPGSHTLSVQYYTPSSGWSLPGYKTTVINYPVPSDDYILKARQIRSSEEKLFSSDDGKISSFWQQGFEDSIVLTPENNSYPGIELWSGEDDLKIHAKTAYGNSGIYLHVTVYDNVWDNSNNSSSAWKYDFLNIFIDSKSSNEIISGGDGIMVMPGWGWALTFTSIHFSTQISGNPNSFTMNYYDNLYFTWAPNEVQFSNSADRYDGLAMEVITESPQKKSVEFFIPWKWVGSQGGVSGGANHDDKVAFTIGYFDMDDDGADVSSVYWKKADPYGPSKNSSSENAKTWGDIEFPTVFYIQ